VGFVVNLGNSRLLVTGYGGFVAGSVVKQAVPAWDVVAFSRSMAPVQGDRFRCWQLDLRDTAKLRETFAEVKPDAVVHAAALANIDYCQSHQDEAECVNVGVTRELARLCGDCGAKMIHCSTDTVFDGEQGMYTEQDQPCAVNFYGDTKIRAEQVVREQVEGGVLARLSLVMGLPIVEGCNSFLANLRASLERGEQVRVPDNEVRTPIDVITLGRALLELAANDFTGALHLAGSTRLGRHAMACRIAQRLGHSTALVIATDSNAIAGRAPRPNDASLDNALARRVLQTPMQTLLDGLELVLTT
jgi:dTDP-4-dehydrorhamnose reductase